MAGARISNTGAVPCDPGNREGLIRSLATFSILILISVVLQPQQGISHPKELSDQTRVLAQKGCAAISLDKLEQWRAAVAEHVPGQVDAATTNVGVWPRDEVLCLVTDMKVLAKLLADSQERWAKSGEISRGFSYRGSFFTPAKVQQVLGLTDDEARRGDMNRLLKRAALLYTDIALLAPDMASSAMGGNEQAVLLVSDGLIVGRSSQAYWELARFLLDSLHPNPASDEMVRQWYQATIAYLQSNGQYAYAQTQLDRAQVIFRSDANILFLNGALHEIFASPWSQAVVLAMPPETYSSVNSEYAELRKAQGYFQQAAKSNPELAEVPLHLGRVSGLLGNHTVAAAELRRAAALLTDPQLQYYAALFLGHEEDMIGHQDAAREQFERAATLYPGAQSPLLALGELMSRNGDYAGALAAMQRVMMLSMYDSRLIDPWWRYHATHVPDAETLMAEMRKTFGGLPR